MKDVDCVELLQWALPQLGLRWPGFRKVRRQVCNRIAGRIRVLGLPDVAAYRHRLESQREEWPALAALCTVSISRFYRDREVFDCLGAIVLPELAGAAALRGRTHLECWSAGCCSGEEPYTLYIQWRLALAGRFPQLALRVLGTDVDATLIERARAACYRTSSLDALPAAWIEQAFERRGRLLCLRERFRQDFELERQDLLAELPRRQFDLVLCRNLAFTYFDSSLQQVAPRAHRQPPALRRRPRHRRPRAAAAAARAVRALAGLPRRLPAACGLILVNMAADGRAKFTP
jgi:chemotaxis protein methyltransferase CheR